MNRGFVLVEMLIAVAVMLVLIATVFALLDPAQGAFQTQPEAADVQQRLRVAAQALASDLSGAGAGSDSGPASGGLGRFLAPVLPYRVGSESPDPPGTFRPDAVTTIAVPATAAQATIRAAIGRDAGSLEINPGPGCPLLSTACGFETVRMALLYDGSGAWDLWPVGEVVGSTVSRRGAALLSKEYGPGTSIVAIAVASYALAGTPPDTALRRYDGDRTDVPLADNIVSLGFEYLGNPEPPMIDPACASAGIMRTTYGPAPPAIGVEDPDTGYPAGENCVFRVQSGQHVPRLPSLSAGPGLVPLAAAVFLDGPWCPAAAAPNRFDADLLRIRQVRVSLRAQAGPASLRGRDPRFFLRPGTSFSARRLVPDQLLQFDVLPRNLSLDR